MRLLNTKNNMDTKRTDLQIAVKTLIGFLETFAYDFQRMATFSNRILALSMSALEAIAIFNNKHRLAQELRKQSKRHTPQVIKFCRLPRDEQAFVDAITFLYDRCGNAAQCTPVSQLQGLSTNKRLWKTL